MPNTLAHIGFQGLVNGPSLRNGYIYWVLLACVIPDVPWILRRLAGLLLPTIDPLQLELYATVQSSLVFCIVLGLGFALLARNTLTVWLIVSVNCAVHLLLDAVEIKPGNGVHLVAPFSWEMTSFAWIWPEHWLISAATVVGALLALALLVTSRFRTTRPALAATGTRAAGAGLVLLVYVAAPMVFLQGPIDANNRGIQAFLDPEQRTGKPIAVDRDRIETRDGNVVLVTTYGDVLTLLGEELPADGIVSLRGYFADKDTVQVTEIHRSASTFRDSASMLGLALILVLWADALYRHFRSSDHAREPAASDLS